MKRIIKTLSVKTYLHHLYLYNRLRTRIPCLKIKIDFSYKLHLKSIYGK